MNCQTEKQRQGLPSFFNFFFLSLFWMFFEGSKISFYAVPGSNPATHRSHSPAGSDCPLLLQSSFPSGCAPVHAGIWIQTPAHQTLKLQEDFQPKFSLFAAISLQFSPFPFPLLCPPAPTQISPAKCHFHSRPRDEGDAHSPSPPTQRGFIMRSASSAHLPTPSSLSPPQPSLLAFPLQTPPGTIFLLSPSNICRALSPLVTPRLSFVQTEQQEEGQGRGAGGQRQGEMGARGAVRP